METDTMKPYYTIEVKWLYLKEDNQLPYDTFSIIDEHGFIVARDIQEAEVAVSIIEQHNLNRPKHDLHFNYTLQVWVKDGIIEDCHHPKCRDNFKTACNSHKYHEDSEIDAMNHYNNTRP